jgi:hypothetical protein
VANGGNDHELFGDTSQVESSLSDTANPLLWTHNIVTTGCPPLVAAVGTVRADGANRPKPPSDGGRLPSQMS